MWLDWGGIRVAGFSLLTDREPVTFLLYYHIGRVFLFRCVLEFWCSWLKPATQIPPQPSHTETPTHIETRTHNQCGDTIEKSQAPDEDVLMSETY